MLLLSYRYLEKRYNVQNNSNNNNNNNVEQSEERSLLNPEAWRSLKGTVHPVLSDYSTVQLTLVGGGGSTVLAREACVRVLHAQNRRSTP